MNGVRTLKLIDVSLLHARRGGKAVELADLDVEGGRGGVAVDHTAATGTG